MRHETTLHQVQLAPHRRVWHTVTCTCGYTSGAHDQEWMAEATARYHERDAA